MKVAIFSHANSIDYRKVGGLESFFRRLSEELIQDGHEVDFVLYGARSEAVEFPQDGLTIRYFKSFTKSAIYLRHESKSVVSNYLKKRHRFWFYILRILERRNISFYRIHSGIEDSKLKHSLNQIPGFYRMARLFEVQIALSETIQKSLKRKGIGAKLCLPPVPEVFFIPASSVGASGDLEVTFVGRLDKNKGISYILELFQGLANTQKFKLNISGYYGHGISSRRGIESVLEKHPEINFHELSWKQWNQEVDFSLLKLLDRTDILVLPYKNLKGTMDPPYLVLEGMAARCAILTTNVGSISDYLSDPIQIIEELSFVRHATDYIHTMNNDRALLSDIQEKNQHLIQNKSHALHRVGAKRWADLICK